MSTPTDPASGRAPSLEQRIGALEDRAQIAELPARYAHDYGRLDLDDLASLYVDDVRTRSGDTGRAALRDQFARGSSGDRGVRLAVLHVGTHVVELAGDGTATGRVLCHGEVERADGSFFHQAIHYDDRYVRTSDGWRFAQQRHHELFYGAEPCQRPNDLAPANWPERDVGRGTLPARWWA